MLFDEAYEIYNSYFPVMGFSHQEKQEFQKSLLHPKYGLRVIVFTSNDNRRCIILSPNDIDLEPFLMTLIDDNRLKQSDTTEHENATFVRKVINSMNTEWDRKCSFALLALNRSRRELEDLTVDPGVVTRNSNYISQVLTEIDNAKIAAEDMVKLRLDSRMKKIKGELTEKEVLYLQKKDRWSNGKLEHLQSEISSLKLGLNEAESFDENNKYHVRKRNQMIKRTQQQLISANRLTRRVKSTGRPIIVDEEVEYFVLKCISEKSISHGRRHDTVLYSSRRVKVKDLLGIANFKLREKGKEIRSATTVWNLSKPKNSRSRQAKLHRGSGLFCTRALYKADDKHNENTHHRRAFKKNVRDFFFSSITESERKFCLMRSIDDKAYLRPGTSEGFNSVRSKRILTPTAKDQIRKLPKYDWPVKQVYQTPSTHRLLMLESFQVDGHEKIGSSGDSHYVFVRPKSYVDSSGTTWASETVWLRHNFPLDFEVDKESSR